MGHGGGEKGLARGSARCLGDLSSKKSLGFEGRSGSRKN